MVFIARRANPAWLALHNNPNPKHGGDIWFVVTGSVEPGERLEDTAVREVLEETGLKVEKITKLPTVHHSYTSRYHPGVVFDEQGFLAIVEDTRIVLNEEHCDYKWVELDEFMDDLHWTDNKQSLQQLLKTTYQNATKDS